MRRAPYVAAAAAAGLAGVVGLHSPPRTSLPLPALKKGSPNVTPTTFSGTPSGSLQTAVGATEQYGYGALSVKVSMRGKQITDVTVASLQTAEPYSQSIATQVIPLLHNEVVSAQSAQINAISGATYTSQAYAYSVQSAIDALHKK